MNILITGCSSGIGYQTVLALAQMGTHHITAIARNTLGLAQLKQEFQALGTKSNIDTITFDLSQAHYDDLISKLNYSNDKPLDILINNAGYLVNASFMETSIEQWHKVFEVNLFAGIKLIKALYPKFNRSKGAHIVNVGSMGGVQGSAKYEGLAAYSASKGAVNILTESLSVEFAKENIHHQMPEMMKYIVENEFWDMRSFYANDFDFLEKSHKAVHYLDLKEGESVGGVLKGVKGAFLLIETPTELVVILAKKLAGKEISFDECEEGISKIGGFQGGLF